MPTAKKLKSGSWRCQVYSHKDENGKRVYVSFTCKDPSPRGKRKCEADAAAWAKDKELRMQENVCEMTFKEACEEYVSLRENVLSERTKESYRSYIKGYLSTLGSYQINVISQRQIQSLINNLAKKLSPKTIQNVHGFISAVFKEYRSDFVLRTKLPAKKAVQYYVPTEADITKLQSCVENSSIEIPVLLAIYCGMRRGEICALESSDITGNRIHVSKSLTKKIVDGHNTWIVKAPKSFSGDRYITCPDFVIEKIKNIDGRICPMCPDSITKRFEDVLKENDLPHFRFHDLRHFGASLLCSMNISMQTILERYGWSDERVLKSVYRHSIKEKTDAETDEINAYFTTMQHKCNTANN